MPADRTPVGDDMVEKIPGHDIPEREPRTGPEGGGEVPTPDNVPPVGNPDPQPGDPKPRAPETDEPGHRTVPVELPGRPHAPERVD